MFRRPRIIVSAAALAAIVVVAQPSVAAPKKAVGRWASSTTSTTAPTSTTSTTAAPASTTSTTAAPTSTTSTTVAPSTTTTTAPAASSSTSSSTLAWAPPTLSNPITVNVSDSTPYWLATFDDTRDYIVKLPATTALHHGIGITGGHHVVLIGGEIAIPSTTTDPEYRVGIKLRNQTGTVHIEGLKITNASDGINMQQQKNATVQLENLYIETPTAYENSDGSGFHADIIQTWAGPTVLRIDHLTGKSAFQGLFFDPNDPNFAPHPAPAQFDLRNINIDSNGSGSGYNYETVTRNTPWTLTGTNIYGTNPTGHVVCECRFPEVTSSPDRDVVEVSGVGVGYQSPGYR